MTRKTEQTVERMEIMASLGASIGECAKVLGVSNAYVSQLGKRHGIEFRDARGDRAMAREARVKLNPWVPATEAARIRATGTMHHGEAEE